MLRRTLALLLCLFPLNAFAAPQPAPAMACQWSDDCQMPVIRPIAVQYSESTGSAYTSMPGFDFDIKAGAVVWAECVFLATADAVTTGIQLQVTGPASATQVTYSRLYGINATVSMGTINQFAFNSGSTDDGATASHGTGIMQTRVVLEVVNGVNAGTIHWALESELNAHAVTVEPGSYCIYWRWS